ncbi:MAG: hypothetical protein MUO63_14890 [Desulfobulbaceae bacterium]|nr:hypothetical protein [Desulfobulbaceae bacterium]
MKKYIFILFIISLTLPETVFSWDTAEKYRRGDGMHQNLMRYASEISHLQPCPSVLTERCDTLTTLGLVDGLEEMLVWRHEGKPVREWLAYGAEKEDAYNTIDLITQKGRFFNHFHNPIETWPWQEAGLDDGVFSGESSLRWMQDSEAQSEPSNPEGDYSWITTRGHYYNALTSVEIPEREEFFARSLKGLGHQVHLLQDKAVPAHVRNDAHPLKYNRFGPTFEKWAEENFNSLADLQSFAPTPVFPQLSFTGPVGSNYVPITQFVDTDKYDGSNPTDELTIGLAEYTNANFFSDDTIFTEEYPEDDEHYFPYPKKISTDLDEPLFPKIRIARDGAEDKVFRIKKGTDGEQIENFLALSYHSNDLYVSSDVTIDVYVRSLYLDEDCHADYAKKLIPRAVGYSTALINYFFRGFLEITDPLASPDSPLGGVYETIKFRQGFSILFLTVRNATMDNAEYPNETIKSGKLVAVARYLLDGTEMYSVSQEIVIQSLSAVAGETFSFDFSNDPVPADIAELSVQVVFQGTLGNEQDIAVAVGREQLILGPIEISPPSEYVYSIIDIADFYDINGEPVAQEFTNLKVSLMNIVAGKEMREGSLTAVAAYKNRTNYLPDLSGNEPPTSADREDSVSYSASAAINIDPLVNPIGSETPVEFAFDFTSEPILAGITDLYLYVVFAGTVNDGQNDEPDSVLMSVKDLNEPHHITFWNNTDYFLLSGVPTKAEDIAEDDPARDSSYINPHDITEKISFSSSPPAQGETVVNLFNLELEPGHYSRVIILTDSPQFNVTDTVLAAENSWLPPAGATFNYYLQGTVNQLNSDGLWHNTPVYNHREVKQHTYTWYMNCYPWIVFPIDVPVPNDLLPVPATIINFP